MNNNFLKNLLTPLECKVLKDAIKCLSKGKDKYDISDALYNYYCGKKPYHYGLSIGHKTKAFKSAMDKIENSSKRFRTPKNKNKQ